MRAPGLTVACRRVSAQTRNSTTHQPRSQSPVYNCSDISHRPQPQTQARHVPSSFFPQTLKTQAATRPPVLLSCALQPTVASHRARLPRHEQEFTHVLWASFRLCCASDAMTRCKPGAARAQLSPRHGCLPAVQQLGLTGGDTWKKPLPLAAVSPPAPVQPGCACSVRPDVCAPTRQTQDACEHTSVSLCTQPGLRHWTGGCFIQRRETETHGTSARGARSSAPAPLVLSWAALPCRQKGPQGTAAGSLPPSQTDGDSQGGRTEQTNLWLL